MSPGHNQKLAKDTFVSNIWKYKHIGTVGKNEAQKAVPVCLNIKYRREEHNKHIDMVGRNTVIYILNVITKIQQQMTISDMCIHSSKM